MPLPKKPVAVRLQAGGLLSDCVAVSGAEVFVRRDILSATTISVFVKLVFKLDFGTILAGLYDVVEGTFSGLNQAVNRILVSLAIWVCQFDCIQLLSGDLHTSKLDDDVSVVCII
tara:strand:- start:130 stop:474 length:345 start_codon:yes stop_codon:yes gene_type:complete